MKMIWLLLKGSNEYFFDFWNLCNIFMNVEVVALQNRITHIVAIPSWLRNQSRYHIILKLLLWSNMVKYHNSHSNTSSQIISFFKRGLLTRHFRNTCIERNRDGVWPRLYFFVGTDSVERPTFKWKCFHLEAPKSRTLWMSATHKYGFIFCV